MSARSKAAELVAKIREWRFNSKKFCFDNFNITLDKFQEQFLDAWDRGDKRLALKACKGPGKTTCLALIGWHFLATRPHPKVGCTSISGDNLNDNLWPEFSKWQQRSPYLKSQFEWTKTRIYAKAHPETWFATARTWSKSADPQQQADALAGLHADYILFLIDESGGVPDAVAVTGEAVLASGIESRIAQAGNPTQLDGPLYRACTKEKHLWTVIQITGDPDNPLRCARISIEWAKSQIDKYGRDNPWVQANVFGEFPTSAINQLLSLNDVEKAQARNLEQHIYSYQAKVIGVDVARGGLDRTVMFPRQGLDGKSRMNINKIFRNLKTEEIVGHVARESDDWGGADAIFIDDTGGWGAGAIDGLLLLGYPVIAVNSSSKAFNPRFFNRRAEMQWEAAEAVKRGASLPDMPEIGREAPAGSYFYNKGKLQIIDKDTIKDIIGESPDVWDAYCLTFGQPVMPRSPEEALAKSMGITLNKTTNQTKHDYDPYSDENMRKTFGD